MVLELIRDINEIVFLFFENEDLNIMQAIRINTLWPALRILMKREGSSFVCIFHSYTVK